MALDIEARYAALFERLKAALAPAGVKTFMRKDVDPDQLPNKPGLVLAATGQLPETAPGQPPIWHLGAGIVLYVTASATDQTPETKLHELVRVAIGALERQPGEPRSVEGDEYWTTLGGLCERCYPSGEIEITQGANGGLGAAVIPIEMVAIES